KNLMHSAAVRTSLRRILVRLESRRTPMPRLRPFRLLTTLLVAPAALAADESRTPPRRDPLVHTYSIVARDSATGEMGVAGQSPCFSVGALVPWAESGVGAVATQSLVLVDYGPNGLDLMRKGVSAPEALKQLLAADTARDGRQVAMIDAQGRVDAWTGPKCIPAAGHHVGAQYS